MLKTVRRPFWCGKIWTSKHLVKLYFRTGFTYNKEKERHKDNVLPMRQKMKYPFNRCRFTSNKISDWLALNITNRGLSTDLPSSFILPLLKLFLWALSQMDMWNKTNRLGKHFTRRVRLPANFWPAEMQLKDICPKREPQSCTVTLEFFYPHHKCRPAVLVKLDGGACLKEPPTPTPLLFKAVNLWPLVSHGWCIILDRAETQRRWSAIMLPLCHSL